ncbi:aspartate kinase [Shewanella algae]|uniref:aspartate kinase n=1 Tax=Shewanella algae TaxID=38313 RepID=UPI001AAC49B0|nr:aspartate kinase [Shewanella algae]
MTQEVRSGSNERLYVKKFGGTSVGSIERIEVIAEQIAKAQLNGEHQVLVLSAMAGETNRLFALAGQIDSDASAREMDMLVSTGEQVSIALMAMALAKRGVKAKSLNAAQVQIHTNSQFGRASIERVDVQYLLELLAQGIIPIVAGFQGRDQFGEVTTLGRGGSDTTAVALAAALKAQECQIFTDVAGVYTTDPNIEPSAQKLDAISFEEMLEMARLGAKVLHPDSVSYAERFRVPLRVLSSFEPGSGTLIRFDACEDKSNQVAGIACSKGQAMLSLSRTDDSPDPFAAVFSLLAENGVEVDLVTKAGTDDSVSFTLDASRLPWALKALDEPELGTSFGPLVFEKALAKVSVIGAGVHRRAEATAKVFDILGNEGIHVKLMATSEIKLSVVIDESDLHRAVRVLHHAFELNKV